jgi:hypothetical protein
MAHPIPPDATAEDGISNDQRSQWAESALLAFARTTGAISKVIGDAEEPFFIIADLLADIAHWCDRNDVNFQSALEYAKRHYRTETGAEGTQLM